MAFFKIKFRTRLLLEERELELEKLRTEFSAYRTRAKAEQVRLAEAARTDAAGQFLSVYDALCRALNAPCTDGAFKAGIEMTMVELIKSMASVGIIKIPAQPGDIFDPTIHEAFEVRPETGYAEGQIIQLLRDGFQSETRVVRPALVVVATLPKEES